MAYYKDMAIFKYIGFIVIIVFTIFFNSLFGEFVALDDELLIQDNPTVHGLTFKNIGRAFTTYDPELYIPLTLLTHQIEWSIVGENPLLYHVTNLVIHSISAVLVFLILTHIFSLNIAFVCALLFALHPLQVEAVSWASGRKDVLSSLFFLASMYSYILWKTGSSVKWQSVLLFLCGLLSKVSIFPLPFCLVLLDRLLGEKISVKTFQEKLPYFLLSTIFLIIALFGKHTQLANPLDSILLSPASVLLTLQHFLYPFELAIVYPFIDAVHWFHPQIISGIFTVIALLLSALYFRSRFFPVFFGIAWFLIVLAPSIASVQRGGELGIPDLYTTSDRYAYLAIIGPIVLFGYFLQKYHWAFGIAPLLIFSIVSWKQTEYWNNSEILFRRVIAVGQSSHLSYANLGGFEAKRGNMQEAEELLEIALSIRTTTDALFNLAQIKAILSKPDEARLLYQQLLQLTPDDTIARQKMNSLFVQ